VFGDEPLYWIERLDPDDRFADFELGFSDVAAHPYQALVRATVDVLAAVPGVVEVWHEDREVVLVRAPGVAPAQLADVVDRFWLDALQRTDPDPAYGDDVYAPDLTRAGSLAPVGVVRRAPRLAEAVRLAPSRQRMWTYAGCGAVATIGGLALATTSGGSSGVVALVLGVANLGMALHIARQRRGLAR
jgi:hypothetical protein